MYSYNPYYGTYLSHFGVKGMKWGVRKDRVRSNKNKKKTKTYKKEIAIKKGHAESALKNFDKYSTQELREVRERAFLKRDLESITSTTKGKKTISDTLKDANTSVKSLTGIAVGAVALGGLLYATRSKGGRAVIEKAATRFA